MQNMNDKFKAIYKVVEKFCFDREDPEKVISNLRFFPEGYDAFGIEDEELKVLRDRILSEYPLEIAEIADLGTILLQTGKYEYGTLAIMLLKKHRPRLDAYVFTVVKGWLDKSIENWAHADLLAFKILPVFFELELCNLESFVSWRDSPGKWTRRAAVMCLNSLKTALDAQELLDFVLPRLSDKEKVVQQAIGIFLSELWNKAHPPVEDFLAEYKDKMDALALKNATTGMPIAKSKLYHPEVPHRKAAPKNRNPKHKRPPKK